LLKGKEQRRGTYRHAGERLNSFFWKDVGWRRGNIASTQVLLRARGPESGPAVKGKDGRRIAYAPRQDVLQRKKRGIGANKSR